MEWKFCKSEQYLLYWQCMQTYAFVDSTSTYCWSESSFAM